MQAMDQRELRDTLGQFATGVTIITTSSSRGPLGITVNSFASVSLDPPLVLWSLAKDSDRFDAFDRTDHFGIHVLPALDRKLAMRFAACGDDFSGLEVEDGAGGTPLLPSYCARFECRVSGRHPGGDHVILVGEVLRIWRQRVEPLVFQGGRFGSFAGD